MKTLRTALGAATLMAVLASSYAGSAEVDSPAVRTGRLIDIGVLDDGEIKGTVEFHPYGELPSRPDGRKASQPVIQDWSSRLIAK